MACSIARFVPHVRHGEIPLEWPVWECLVRPVVVASCDYIGTVAQTVEQWAVVLEDWAVKHRFDSWTEWALKAVSAPGMSEAHRYVKGPTPWQPMQCSPMCDACTARTCFRRGQGGEDNVNVIRQ